ncbi:MAG: hypothetical protein E7392_05000 [Ruminococcaceae bacterium]|nr:hypothetical protein [Oscillospiraceae bacterium]
MNKEKLLNILKNTAAVVVILSMFVIIFYQNRDRDIFKFKDEENSSVITSQGGDAVRFSGGDIRKVGDRVAYITTTSLNFYNEAADCESVTLALSKPVLHTEGEYLVCYNEDSLEAEVYKENRLYYSIKTENRIVGAKVNKNGYLLIATEKEGYNCECMIYNRSGEAIFKWDISKSEFIDADINYDNDAIVLSLAAAGKEKLVGEIILLDITDAKVIEKKTFDSKVFYSVNFNRNGTFTALGSHTLSYFNADGTQKWAYDYEEKTLIKADVSNPDMMVTALSDSGSVTVKVINRLGKVTAEKSYTEMIDDISVSESGIGLAFGKNIYITDSSLHEKKNIQSKFGANKIELYNDNKHLFVLGSADAEILE